ncbi:MAG: LexA repressor [Chlamydiae bacterium]|nr:LexA repressor [Chlamydiota bacterium]
MKGLTKRQMEILGFIQEFIDTHNYSPSYREIMHHFQFSSIGSVSKHINVLKRKGALIGEKQCSRSLQPTESKDGNTKKIEIELPFIGHISTHTFIETFPQAQTLVVPAFLLQAPEKTYAIRARDNSFNDEMIRDGDLLLVEARSTALDGETIIATALEHSTLIKKYHPEGNHVRLTSHSQHLEPLLLRNEDLNIQGVVVGLLRLFH